jgi:hypothetical protein
MLSTGKGNTTMPATVLITHHPSLGKNMRRNVMKILLNT